MKGRLKELDSCQPTPMLFSMLWKCRCGLLSVGNKGFWGGPPPDFIRWIQDLRGGAPEVQARA